MPLFPIQPRYTTMTLAMPNTQEMILVVNVEATRVFRQNCTVGRVGVCLLPFKISLVSASYFVPSCCLIYLKSYPARSLSSTPKQEINSYQYPNQNLTLCEHNYGSYCSN